jgi:hypothetical protein
MSDGKLFSKYFSEQLDKLKVGNATIKDIRQTTEYGLLQSELAKMHGDEVTKDLSCAMVTNLYTPELKARLELMSPYRAHKAPAPTGMKQTDLINEYLRMIYNGSDQAFPLVVYEEADGSMRPVDPSADRAEHKEPEDMRAVLTMLHELGARLAAVEQGSKSVPPVKPTQQPGPPSSGGPSDNTRKQREQASRANRFIEGLERGASADGLGPEARGLLGAFMGTDISTVHTHAPPHTLPWSSSDLSRPLFPGRPSGQLAAEHATVLVKDALTASRKRQSFGSFEKFHAAFKPWYASLVHGDSQKAMHCFNYYAFIVTLAFEKSWAAAEAYHWLLFERVERGEYDLADGPSEYMCLRKIDQAYPTRANKGGRSNGSSRSKRTDLTFCPLHGWCGHTPATCERSKDNGGDGTKAPNFRSEK